jgi:energy-coupling factor transporter ATP-binding protein EcfA2
MIELGTNKSTGPRRRVPGAEADRPEIYPEFVSVIGKSGSGKSTLLA